MSMNACTDTRMQETILKELWQRGRWNITRDISGLGHCRVGLIQVLCIIRITCNWSFVERDATEAVADTPISAIFCMQLCTLHNSCCDVSRPSFAKVCAAKLQIACTHENEIINRFQLKMYCIFRVGPLKLETVRFIGGMNIENSAKKVESRASPVWTKSQYKPVPVPTSEAPEDLHPEYVFWNTVALWHI